MKIGSKIALTKKAHRGLALALGQPVEGSKSSRSWHNVVWTPNNSKPLPTYGIVTEISESGRFITADWFYYAGKFAYSRTFTANAVYEL